MGALLGRCMIGLSQCLSLVDNGYCVSVSDDDGRLFIMGALLGRMIGLLSVSLKLIMGAVLATTTGGYL